MFRGMGVAVVMPAYDEEAEIEAAISALPELVDLLVVVDDGSIDRTAEIAIRTALKCGQAKQTENEAGLDFRIIQQPNQGVGRAVYNGFQLVVKMHSKGELANLFPHATKWSVVVMDADNQMDASDLPALLEPLHNGAVDHVKGDRSSHAAGLKGMPLGRRFGSVLLTRLTRWASGHRDVNDPQCGFRAVSMQMLKRMNLENCWEGYGYPNHWLIESGKRGFKLEQVAVRCVYGDEISGLKVRIFIPAVSMMLFHGLWSRGWSWYVRGEGMAADSLLSRIFVSSGWFGGLLALGMILVNPVQWLSLGLLSAIGFSCAGVVDAIECRRRFSTASRNSMSRPSTLTTPTSLIEKANKARRLSNTSISYPRKI